MAPIILNLHVTGYSPPPYKSWGPHAPLGMVLSSANPFHPLSQFVSWRHILILPPLPPSCNWQSSKFSSQNSVYVSHFFAAFQPVYICPNTIVHSGHFHYGFSILLASSPLSEVKNFMNELEATGRQILLLPVTGWHRGPEA